MAIKNITVLGSGVMGHGIAQISSAAGYDVVIRDIEEKFLESAMAKIQWSLEKLVSKEKISGDEAGAILARIRPVVDLPESVADADLVIEAVPEIMDLKKRVYSELDRAVDRDIILASNTSTLPITEIGTAISNPGRFVGIHFFNPPQLMKLVEVIPGSETSRETTDATLKYVESVGKQTVLCRKDVPGFIVNRLFIPMVHEACYLRDRTGASLEEIDSAVKFRMGFPMGIFELADYTGMDVIHKATAEMHLRDKKVVNPHPIVEKMFNEKRLGQKSGSGYYEYGDDKYHRIDLSEDLAAKCDPVQLVATVINNASWLVTHGVSDVDEIEKAARLGLGLKRPIFETAREIGMDRIVGELKSLASAHGIFYDPDPMLLRH